MDSRFERLADIAVHGANVQPGQIVMVGAEIGQEEQARMTAAAAYKRGAKFVDVEYFDPFVKRARIANAEPETLSFVPAWYGERLLEFASGGGSRIQLHGITAANPLAGLDPALAGKDMLPRVKEWTKVVGDRTVDRRRSPVVAAGRCDDRQI